MVENGVASEGDGVYDADRDEEDDLYHGKGGVVPCPMVFGLFSVVRHFVNERGVEGKTEAGD